MALRNMFGKDLDLGSLPAELRGLLEDMRKERSAFEAAVVRSAETQRIAEELGAQVAKAQQQVGPLTERLAGLQDLAAQVEAIRKASDAATAATGTTSAQLDETRKIVTVSRTELDGLREKLQEALALKKDVAGLLAEQGRITELAARLKETADRATQVQAVHDRVQQGSEEATRRLATMDERFDKVGADAAAFLERAAGFERTAEELRQLMSDLPNVKRELGALRAMADVVTQKTAAVEGQRDAVDRATKGAERLAELVGQVDRQLQEQQGNLGFLERLEEQVRELKDLHATLLERAEEVRKEQRTIDEDARAQREAFDRNREMVQDALAGFAYERDGLAAMNQRVMQMRETLAAVEQRLPSLDAVKSALEQTGTAADQLAARVAAVAEEVHQVEATSATLRDVRGEAQGIAATARELLSRAEGLSRPAMKSLEETERRVVDLNTTLDALERRAAQLDGHRTAISELNHDLATRQGALDAAVTQLDQATALREEASRMVSQLERDTDLLREKLDGSAEAARRADRQLDELGDRSRRFEEVRAKVERFELRFTALLGAEESVERALARAAERQTAVDAVRDDLTRLFGIADSTATQVRTVVALQKEIDQRRTALEEVSSRLRDLDRQGERVEERAHQFEEAEQRLAQLDAHVSGLQATLETVLEQKDFLDRVIETAGALSFQTMQAEGVLTQLRQEHEKGESVKKTRK